MNEKYFLTSLHNSYQGRVLMRVTAEEDVLGGEDNMFFQLLLERSIFILVFTAVSPLLLSSGGKGRSSQNGNRDQEERVLGGTHPPDGKYPSLARIEYDVDENGKYSRWGIASIINRDWLLAAATTFATITMRNLSLYRVVLGDSFLNDTHEPYEQIVYIERIILHERYHGGRQANNELVENLAVVKVTPQIKFSNRVTSINLPSCEEEVPLGTAWLPGWGPGKLSGNGSRPSDYQLKEIDIEINTLEKCNQRLKEVGRPNIKLTDLYICTNETDGKGVCLGDWGSPLFLIKNESYMVQVGMFTLRPAYPFRCDLQDQVGVYLRLSKYLGWIHRRISGCGNHPFHPTIPYYVPPKNQVARDQNS